MTIFYDNFDLAAKNILHRVGKKIVIGVPVGIGKPVGLLNALYRLVSADHSLQLTILTGLTLARPILKAELEKRFVEPILQRQLGDYEDLLYEKARVHQNLPANIHVIEFYLSPGKYLYNSSVQQDYINSNYTSVIRDSLNFSINVIAQQITKINDEYSLSSNTDLFKDVVNYFKNSTKKNELSIVGEINLNLPVMHGDAIVDRHIFTEIIDEHRYRKLFSIPHPELTTTDHLIGLYTSTLIKDGSCLQIGIGKLGDAVANALIFRQKNNDAYQDSLDKLLFKEKFGDTFKKLGDINFFENGIYSSTEMFSDAYIHLLNENILKKQVYDHPKLQELLNKKELNETISPQILDVLLENQVIQYLLTYQDFLFLKKFGILKSEVEYQDGKLILLSGKSISANLNDSESKKIIINECLGNSLKSGKIIHAGFFIGSDQFYQMLRELPLEKLQKIEMTRISRTNSMYWSPELLTLQRQNARFINAAMMVTLSGAIISDGLIGWREVSGVGGQFDFAYMAQQLQNARFIINCHSTRKTKNKITSNIVFDYPNVTVPRHMRDIIITEYGIADCRSKTDSDVIKALLNITDSRFQEDLLKKVKIYGKIPDSYEIPKQFQNNSLDTIQPIINELKLSGYVKPYPFECPFTNDELIIKNALIFLNNCGKIKLIFIFFISLFCFFSDSNFENYLMRMNLNKARSLKELIYKKVLKLAIKLTKK